MGKEHQGYILLWRKIRDTKELKGKATARIIFQDLILEASHKKHTHKKAGKLERGQVPVSETEIRNWYKEYAGRRPVYLFSRWQIRRAMTALMNARMIARTKRQWGSVVTILNYDKWQAGGKDETLMKTQTETQTETQMLYKEWINTSNGLKQSIYKKWGIDNEKIGGWLPLIKFGRYLESRSENKAKPKPLTDKGIIRALNLWHRLKDIYEANQVIAQEATGSPSLNHAIERTIERKWIGLDWAEDRYNSHTAKLERWKSERADKEPYQSPLPDGKDL